MHGIPFQPGGFEQSYRPQGLTKKFLKDRVGNQVSLLAEPQPAILFPQPSFVLKPFNPRLPPIPRRCAPSAMRLIQPHSFRLAQSQKEKLLNLFSRRKPPAFCNRRLSLGELAAITSGDTSFSHRLLPSNEWAPAP